MKIEFWLDYLSPACYKQHQSLETLLKKYQFSDLEILYRSYEMVPNLIPNDTLTLEDVLIQHHMINADEAKSMTKDFCDGLKVVSVTDAHRLSHLAKKSDLAFAFQKEVFKAYYLNLMDISDHDVLRYLAQKVGMKRDQVDQVLQSDLHMDAVRLNRENAIVKGIFEVPHIRIDGKIRLSGYHDDQQMIEAITMASIRFRKTDYCEGEHCERKKTH